MSVPFPNNLSDCTSDPQRAEWLIRAPTGWFAMSGGSIRADIDKAGFVAGMAYFEERVRHALTVRLPDGGLPATMLQRLYELEGAMNDAARRGKS